MLLWKTPNERDVRRGAGCDPWRQDSQAHLNFWQKKKIFLILALLEINSSQLVGAADQLHVAPGDGESRNEPQQRARGAEALTLRLERRNAGTRPLRPPRLPGAQPRSQHKRSPARVCGDTLKGGPGFCKNTQTGEHKNPFSSGAPEPKPRWLLAPLSPTPALTWFSPKPVCWWR